MSAFKTAAPLRLHCNSLRNSRTSASETDGAKIPQKRKEKKRSRHTVLAV